MDVNNKTLAVLLIAGMVLSIAGTLSVLNSGMTGFATQSNVTGTVHYNVSSNVVISFTDDTIEFGTGYVNTTGGAINCSLTTEASGNSDNCVDFTTQANSPFVLDNIGNKDVELNLTFTTDVTTLFIEEAGSLLQLKVTDADAGACTGTQSLSGYTDATTFDNNVEITACGTFESTPGTNTIDIDVNLTISMDESGSETVTLKAIGTE